MPLRRKTTAGTRETHWLVGTWTTMTKNTTLSFTFNADGTWVMNSESAYSGTSHDQYGNVDQQWSAGGQSDDGGTWQAVGDERQGMLGLMNRNGQEAVYNYRVHEEHGRVFWREYWFGNSLYSRQ
jgi:hypothetical protein